MNTISVTLPEEVERKLTHESRVGLVNIVEFDKAKEFILKALSQKDIKILKETYQFDIHELDIKDSNFTLG